MVLSSFTVQTVPIFKNSGKCAVRPLGLRTPLLKVFHKQVVTQNMTEVKAFWNLCNWECQELVLKNWSSPSGAFSTQGLTLCA